VNSGVHYPHRIRLRGPWRCEPRPDVPGRVRFRRGFGYPGRIDDYERVWLTFAGFVGSAEVWLGPHRLGRNERAGEPFEFDVTRLLAPRNEVVIDMEGPSPLGEVALEVRRTAFLRGVGVRAEAGGTALHVVGTVVGRGERPLDLYALLDGATAAYTTVEPCPEGRAFDVTTGPGRRVRVELVDGGSVWYAVECEVPPP
jgi:hypothetical protein